MVNESEPDFGPKLRTTAHPASGEMAVRSLVPIMSWRNSAVDVVRLSCPRSEAGDRETYESSRIVYYLSDSVWHGLTTHWTRDTLAAIFEQRVWYPGCHSRFRLEACDYELLDPMCTVEGHCTYEKSPSYIQSPLLATGLYFEILVGYIITKWLLGLSS